MPARKSQSSTKRPARQQTKGRTDTSAQAPTNPTPAAAAQIPPQIEEFLKATAIPAGFVNRTRVSVTELRRRFIDLNLRPTVPFEALAEAISRIKPAAEPVTKMPEDVQASMRALKPELRRFHGAKVALSWFPLPLLLSNCADKFGYMSSQTARATALPFTGQNNLLLTQLGNMMGDPARDPNAGSNVSTQAGVSNIPAGYTYFGQFVDHDITFDVSSSLNGSADANTINNMRSPSLDLDSVYGRGPALDPFLYEFPAVGNPTAIKLLTGTNSPAGPGGPSSNGTAGGMGVQTRWDVPRVSPTRTAAIGDPRNDENLIVVQLHHAMLRFHNEVVDLLVSAGFAGDVFAEAKRIAIHHYQWAVVNDFLKRICGATAVTNALSSVSAPVGSPFRMPVEFAVAAYRFGHSMIRDFYWVNFNFINATLGQVFAFSRMPNLPVLSNWVVDFNAFFDTGVTVPVNNKARRIDSFLANGLESLPGFSGMMAILATRNLLRGLALGVPSGQGMAAQFGITPMTTAQLITGLPPAEVTLLNSTGGLLRTATPLWYYVLREAAVLQGGHRLGPVGARIVAETFVRILKRDAGSYLNVTGGFTPMLPSAISGDFTVADLLIFAGVTQP